MTEGSGLDTLYREIVRDHSKDPRNFGPLEDADVSQEGFNPLCGDRIRLQLKFSPERDRVSKFRFTGTGCSICMASASILAEEAEGEKVERFREEIETFRGVMQGKEAPESLEGDAGALAGVRNFPVRIKCALLAWMALRDALNAGSSPGNSDLQGKGAGDGAGYTQTE